MNNDDQELELGQIIFHCISDAQGNDRITPCKVIAIGENYAQVSSDNQYFAIFAGWSNTTCGYYRCVSDWRRILAVTAKRQELLDQLNGLTDDQLLRATINIAPEEDSNAR